MEAQFIKNTSEQFRAIKSGIEISSLTGKNIRDLFFKV